MSFPSLARSRRTIADLARTAQLLWSSSVRHHCSRWSHFRICRSLLCTRTSSEKVAVSARVAPFLLALLVVHSSGQEQSQMIQWPLTYLPCTKQRMFYLRRARQQRAVDRVELTRRGEEGGLPTYRETSEFISLDLPCRLPLMLLPFFFLPASARRSPASSSASPHSLAYISSPLGLLHPLRGIPISTPVPPTHPLYAPPAPVARVPGSSADGSVVHRAEGDVNGTQPPPPEYVDGPPKYA